VLPQQRRCTPSPCRAAGRRDEARAELGRARDEGGRYWWEAMADPAWEVWREDPRFQALMAKVKVDVDAMAVRVDSGTRP